MNIILRVCFVGVFIAWMLFILCIDCYMYIIIYVNCSIAFITIFLIRYINIYGNNLYLTIMYI